MLENGQKKNIKKRLAKTKMMLTFANQFLKSRIIESLNYKSLNF